MSDSNVDQAVDDHSTIEIAGSHPTPASTPQPGDGAGAGLRPGAFTALRRRPDWGFLLACFVIAAGIVAIAWAVAGAVTGDDGIDRPDAIENLSPVENAQQVVQQEQIVVDLQFGYDAVLVIDGIELPTTRLGEFEGNLTPDTGGQISIPPNAVFDPGNSRIEFRPSDDALITSFTQGRHQAKVIYWLIEDGRENGARSYTWSFDVV